MLAVMICFLSGYGQEKPSFVAVRSGISVPFGKYHQKSLDGGSFTLLGFNVSAEGAWFFNPKFGVGASVGMNLHPVDVGVLGYELVQHNLEYTDIYTRSETYKMFTAMGGAYVQLPIKSKFSFTGKALCGLLYGKTPYQIYNVTWNTELPFIPPDRHIFKTSSTNWKFSWQAGFGLRYDITPCYGLVLDTELIYDQLSFGFDNGATTRIDVKTVSFFNTTLGVRFNL